MRERLTNKSLRSQFTGIYGKTTHTQTLSLSLSLTLTLTYTHTHTHTHSHTHTQTLSLSLTLTYTHTLTHTHSNTSMLWKQNVLKTWSIVDGIKRLGSSRIQFCTANFKSGLLQSVSQNYINKARWLFSSQVCLLLHRASYLDAAGAVV